MVEHACLDEAELRAFLLGEVPDVRSRAIGRHLEACPDCEAAAMRLEGVTDPFIDSLRRGDGAAPSTLDLRTLPPPPDAPPGETLGIAGAGPAAGCVAGYRLLGELGRGGMGVVYRAHQKHPARTVALKMIVSGVHAGLDEQVRFFAEADAIARLNHPNIVQVYEVDRHGSPPFFSLEYIDGGNLEAKIAGLPQPPRECAALARTLARAVHYAHSRGVIHRDLKPANVLLTADGTPKVGDFGLAVYADAIRLTRTGTAVGTASYMAPEQAVGDSKAVGPAADVYSLGAILYELLTGRPPFRGATNLATLELVCGQEPVSPSLLQPRVPRDLETICLKCLHKSPGGRYASAEALADDLGRFLEGRPIAARPVGPAGRAWRWARRNPAWAGMTASVAALLLVIAVGASVMSYQSGQRLERANRAEREANARLWESYLLQARGARMSQRRGQRFEALKAVRKALALPVPERHSLAELRTEAAAALALPDAEVIRELKEGWPVNSAALCFSADCRRYARGDTHGNVSIREVDGDREIMSLKGWGPLAFAGGSFSPDGRFFQHCCGRVPSLKLWRLDGAAPEVVFEVEKGAFESTVAFRDDSRQLAVSRPGGSIGLYDTIERGEPKLLRPGFPAGRLAFRPGGRQLAAAGGGLVCVLDAATGRVVAELPHPQTVYSIAWSPDGRTLATGCQDNKIRLWDVDRGLARPPLQGHRGRGIWVAFDKAGDRLVSSDWWNSLRFWDARTGRLLLTTTGGMEASTTAAEGIVGVEFVGTRLKLLRLEFGRELVSLALAGTPGTERNLDACLSPDGKHLLVSRDDRLAFIDWAGGVEVGAIPRRSTDPVGFEPAGTLLTHGAGGLLRWPIREDPAEGVWHVGPPRTILSEWTGNTVGLGADGRVLGVPRRGGPVVLHRPRRLVPLRGEGGLGTGGDVRFCAVSPDGRWVATGRHGAEDGKGATVWDADTGRPVKDLPVGRLCLVRFSPDGKWLATSGGGVRLWRVGSWEEGPRLGPPARWGSRTAFSPDGKLMAFARDFGEVRLVDPATGNEVARLSVPENTQLEPQCFSPDGTRFVAIGIDSPLIYVWDLRAIRVGLKELGLDWEWPEFPPAGPPASPALPVRVDPGVAGGRADPAGELAAYTLAVALVPINPEGHYRRAAALSALGRPEEAVAACTTALLWQPGHAGALRLRAGLREALNKWEGAVADWRRLVELQPNDSRWPNELAWAMVAGPPASRDPERALPLARKAMAMDPSDARRNTLGVVLYRLGRFREAAGCFEANLKRPGAGKSVDLLFLAMCQHRLGEKARARASFDRAVAQRRARPKPTARAAHELDAFEAEARAALGLGVGPQ